ncbi:hypothetical protein D5018_12900 [Parashewanella curva]|uniref:Uncharacterized protein n=1 Tax=Parashewanella curva TaxID=2338552 RepID=A0A3L8PXW9_9GAMM|nr:hypothetical protein [Parashewanella curva]RLV59308.1 hypothetical protein D5018_12900 [Parashewanella curva]
MSIPSSLPLWHLKQISYTLDDVVMCEHRESSSILDKLCQWFEAENKEIIITPFLSQLFDQALPVMKLRAWQRLRSHAFRAEDLVLRITPYRHLTAVFRGKESIEITLRDDSFPELNMFEAFLADAIASSRDTCTMRSFSLDIDRGEYSFITPSDETTYSVGDQIDKTIKLAYAETFFSSAADKQLIYRFCYQFFPIILFEQVFQEYTVTFHYESDCNYILERLADNQFLITNIFRLSYKENPFELSIHRFPDSSYIKSIKVIATVLVIGSDFLCVNFERIFSYFKEEELQQLTNNGIELKVIPRPEPLRPNKTIPHKLNSQRLKA